MGKLQSNDQGKTRGTNAKGWIENKAKMNIIETILELMEKGAIYRMVNKKNRNYRWKSERKLICDEELKKKQQMVGSKDSFRGIDLYHRRTRL